MTLKPLAYYKINCKIHGFGRTAMYEEFIGQYICPRWAERNEDKLVLGPKINTYTYCHNIIPIRYFNYPEMKNISEFKLLQHSLYICSNEEFISDEPW